MDVTIVEILLIQTSMDRRIINTIVLEACSLKIR
jgi:hypothetical protein